MFPIVVAPPLVYLVRVRRRCSTSARSGLHDRKVLIDTAANWLVYGFPAIAGATAAVLIIAGVRLIIRRWRAPAAQLLGRRRSRRSSCGSANVSRSSVWLTSSRSA